MSKRVFLPKVCLLLMICLSCVSTGCRSANPYGSQQVFQQPVLQQPTARGYGQFNQRSFGQRLPQIGGQAVQRFRDLLINRGMNQAINGIFGAL